MSKKGVIVYWIAEDFSIQSKVLYPYHLKGGASYVSESWHISNDAEHIEIIQLDRSGNSHEKIRLENLKKKASELLNAKED